MTGLSATQVSADSLERYKALFEISDVIVRCRNLADLFHQLAECLHRVVFFDSVAVGLLEEDKASLRLALFESRIPQEVEVGFTVPLDAVPGGWVVKHQQPYMWTAEDKDTSFTQHHRDVLLRSGLKASFHLPLSTSLSRLGELIFVFQEIVELDDKEREFMQLVANQVAVAIENARNFEQTRRAQQRYQMLLDISDLIHACQDLDQLFSKLAELLRRVVAFDAIAVGLLEPGKPELRLRLFESWVQQAVGVGLTIPINAVPAGWVIEHQQALRVLTDDNDPRFQLHNELLRKAGLAVSYHLPLTTSLSRLGELAFGFRSNEVELPESELQFMQRVADQVAVAIENASNFDAARTAEREAARERDRSQLLLEVNNAVVSHLDLRELLKSISPRLRQVLPNDGAFLALLDADGQTLRLHALEMIADIYPFVEGIESTLDGIPEGEAIRTKKPVLVRQMDFEKYHSPLVKKAYEVGIRAGCTVPLIAHGHVLGSLAVVSTKEAAYDEADMELLDQCGNQIAIAVENALNFRDLEALKEKLAQEKLYLEDEIRSNSGFEEIIGESPALRQVLQMVETVAPSDSTVLLLGDTGTGKELIARAIHEHSKRKGRTFVKLNCAAIPTGLLESELFGHEKGAFTGAIAQRIGRLELADQGTLFLDEVGDVPTEIQPKLLRALQEREFERLGSVHTKKVNVRLIAATNRNLEKMVEDREFRSDLYYRLNVFPIRIPPLRERPEDIPLLVRYFVQKYARQMQKKIDSIPAADMTRLQAWNWPGNVRELENFIERAVILTNGSALQVPLTELKSSAASAAVASPAITLHATEREHILKVLRDTKGVLAGPNGAASRLGLKRTTLQSKMKKLGIARDAY
jgi:formate hydrogenlyase transcriptional activator